MKTRCDNCHAKGVDPEDRMECTVCLGESGQAKQIRRMGELLQLQEKILAHKNASIAALQRQLDLLAAFPGLGERE